jgi:hypothetical protein
MIYPISGMVNHVGCLFTERNNLEQGQVCSVGVCHGENSENSH